MTPITRFAPSPTGQLHLGHVAAMIHVWGLAAWGQAAVHVRIEDHDRQRCRPQYVDDLKDVLMWLGFVPQGGGGWSQQSACDERYQQALTRLRDLGLVYACSCSRKATEHEPGATEGRYPGHCRERKLPDGPGTCLRLRLPDSLVEFVDARHGRQTQHPARQCGDLVIRDRLGQWTYQFAVVVDDLCDQITWVIRGDDLLASTGRQLLLAGLLGRQQAPAFFHHPLILDRDGAKLSKREFAPPVSLLRKQGQTAAQVIGAAAHGCGLQTTPTPISAREVPGLFSSWTSDRLFPQVIPTRSVSEEVRQWSLAESPRPQN